jgi:hypothetical protein
MLIRFSDVTLNCWVFSTSDGISASAVRHLASVILVALFSISLIQYWYDSKKVCCKSRVVEAIFTMMMLLHETYKSSSHSSCNSIQKVHLPSYSLAFRHVNLATSTHISQLANTHVANIFQRQPCNCASRIVQHANLP